MQALILAGGKGTRLRPLTVYTPKPVVPLMNRPFLTYQLAILAKGSVSDVTLSLNYQPNKIEEVIGDGRELGAQVRYVTEPSPMGTAGAFRFAADSDAGTTVVFNGDILTDIDISDLLELHRSRGFAATIALARVKDPSRYGLVETDDEGNVIRFREKPGADEIRDLKLDTINAGIYVLEPSVLELIPEGKNSSFEYDVFPAILEKGMKFGAYILNDTYWRDIGNPQSYLEAHLDILDGRVRGLPPAARPVDADIATAAVVDSRSVIGDGCVIKPGARVANSVLGPGVHIDEKAQVTDSVIWAYTRVAAGAAVSRSVLGRGCHIGRSTVLGPGTVLGDKASIPDYSCLGDVS
jgi:mannose-1-phosphate guanylyltransferase